MQKEPAFLPSLKILIRQELLEQLSLAAKNCLPPTSKIHALEGIFKETTAKIFIPEDKICRRMAISQKGDLKEFKKRPRIIT